MGWQLSIRKQCVLLQLAWTKLDWVYFFKLSRISRSSTTSSGVGAGAAGAAGVSFFMRFICLTIMKTIKAKIMKFTATVMKLP